MNMYFVGYFTDLIINLNLVPKPTNLVGQAALLLLSVVFVGVRYFLGGPVGIGTVVTALSIGYSVQYSFKLGNFEGKSLQMNLWELYSYLKDKER